MKKLGFKLAISMIFSSENNKVADNENLKKVIEVKGKNETNIINVQYIEQKKINNISENSQYNEVKQEKSIAIISYILFVGPLIALSMNSENKNQFASFHIRQGLGLTLTFIVLGVSISYFDNIMIAAPMWIFISILTIYGIFTAAKGELTPLPLLGKLFQKTFKNI